MISLKERFLKRGKRYTQIHRDEDMVLYRVDNEHERYYEVFRIKISNPNDFVNDEYERYPGDECFGDWAYCCSNRKSLEKVLKKHFPNIGMDNIFKNTSN